MTLKLYFEYLLYYIKYQDWNDFFAKIWGLGLMRWPKKNESYLNHAGVCVCVWCVQFSRQNCVSAQATEQRSSTNS